MLFRDLHSALRQPIGIVEPNRSNRHESEAVSAEIKILNYTNRKSAKGWKTRKAEFYILARMKENIMVFLRLDVNVLANGWEEGGSICNPGFGETREIGNWELEIRILGVFEFRARGTLKSVKCRLTALNLCSFV